MALIWLSTRGVKMASSSHPRLPKDEPSGAKIDVRPGSSSTERLPFYFHKKAHPSMPWRWSRKPGASVACEFRRQIQAQGDLFGMATNSRWVQSNYPLFCLSLGIDWQPTQRFRKRARPPDERRQEWHVGKRVGTSTFYAVPYPNEAVVALSEEMRKRAGGHLPA